MQNDRETAHESNFTLGGIHFTIDTDSMVFADGEPLGDYADVMIEGDFWHQLTSVLLDAQLQTA